MCYTVERELPKQARVDVSAAVCSREGGDNHMTFSDVIQLLSLIVEIIMMCYVIFHKKK